MVSGDEHLFMCLLNICTSFFEKCLFRYFTHINFFKILSCVSSLYILILALYQLYNLRNIFPPFLCDLFHFVDSFLFTTKALVDVILFTLIILCLRRHNLKKYFKTNARRYLVCFLPTSLMVSRPYIKSSTHFEFITHDIRK